MTQRWHAFVVAALLILCGCASYNISAPRSVPYPPAWFGAKNEGSATIALMPESRIVVIGRDNPRVEQWPFNSRVMGTIEQPFNESEYFRVVDLPDAADYRLVLKGRDNSEMSPWVSLTLATAALVPVPMDSSFDISAGLYDREGRLLAKQVTECEMRWWFSLWVLFYLGDVNEVEERLWEDVARDLVVWTHDAIEASRASAPNPATGG